MTQFKMEPAVGTIIPVIDGSISTEIVIKH